MPISRDFEALKEAVFTRRPALREVLRRHGDEILMQYAETLKDGVPSVSESRRNEFIGEVSAAVRKNLGDARAESVERQLRRSYYVSTADHLGILNHPFFINGNLMASLPYAGRNDSDHENTIVLAFGNISLNNSSWPRSLSFHLDGPPGTGQQRLSFFSAADHLSPVFRFRAFDKQDIEKLRQTARRAYEQKKYSMAAFAQIDKLVSEVYDRPEVLACRYFSDQLTMTNPLLWQKFFESSGQTLPQLAYLQQEDIVLSLLKKYHLSSDTDLHAFIFDAEVAERIKELFNDIPGAFSIENRKGTYLFWYYPHGSKIRIPLWREGDELVSLDGSHHIPLTPEKIGELIDRHELIPGMMLSLVTLSCYYGVKCLGGFSQVDYLTSMARAYDSIFGSEADSEPSFTQGLCGELVVGVVFSEGKLAAATGLDLILYGDKGTYARYKENAERITLYEAVALMMPEFYRILYREGERSKELASLTSDDIYSILELSNRLVPCLQRE